MAKRDLALHTHPRAAFWVKKVEPPPTMTARLAEAPASAYYALQPKVVHGLSTAREKSAPAVTEAKARSHAVWASALGKNPLVIEDEHQSHKLRNTALLAGAAALLAAGGTYLRRTRTTWHTADDGLEDTATGAESVGRSMKDGAANLASQAKDTARNATASVKNAARDARSSAEKITSDARNAARDRGAASPGELMADLNESMADGSRPRPM
jgi:hypothetical protein